MRLRIVITILIVAAMAVPLGAYVTLRQLSNTNAVVQIKWSTGAFPLKWQINSAVTGNVSGSVTAEDVFKASFASWQAVPTANLSFAELAPTAASVKPGYDKINLVTTNLTSTEYASSAIAYTNVFSFDQGGVIDQYDRPIDFAGQIVEADILFNPSENFSTNASTAGDRFDLQSIATHEIGHFLGLDHSSQISATMFPYSIKGVNYARAVSADDIAGVSSIYPNASFSSKGVLSGTVRTFTNTPVHGAIVVAVNANGQPVASAVTDPTGKYTIMGLDSGSYTIYAEPLDKPITSSDLYIYSFYRIFGSAPILTNFTTRFR